MNVLLLLGMEIAKIKIAREIWERKYRFTGSDGVPCEARGDGDVKDTFARVAKALAKPEQKNRRPAIQEAFYQLMLDYKFLLAGRILAGAGTGREVTLFNCFVMGRAKDSISGIFEELKHAALAMQQGGGIGQDFSTIRPKGAEVKSIGADASGPISFMSVWDAMCRTIMSAGARRGAMMATLACDHPDVEAFIDAKRDGQSLRMFNLSVLISDAFMVAVKDDAQWPLIFDGKVFKIVRAKALWDKIMQSNYESAEPGVIFIDRINRLNNLSYCETIYSTNPCGEQPLPPFGACLLGSMNLTQFIENAFDEDAQLNEQALGEAVTVAVRMLDNVIDVSKFPLPQLEKEAKEKRRIGLGVTGLADALAMCKLSYGSSRAVDLSTRWMSIIETAAYRASALLAKEKGSFPRYEEAAFCQSHGVKGLDDETRQLIKQHGMRNGLVTSIAPTGTISLFAGNVSSGVEPIFASEYTRKILRPDGSHDHETVVDYAVSLYRRKFGEEVELPPYFVSVEDLTPAEHLAMQGAMQKHVDSAISKTINCAAGISFDDFKQIYSDAYELGLKGCTTYRPNDVTGSVLSQNESGAQKEPVESNGDIVYMKQPLERETSLPGNTYKLKWPDSAHAIYITVNDIVQSGRRRPFEVFINSKNMEHYAWTVALTRMISAVFRRGGDVSFVVEELKAVFDPRGGQWMDGEYVPSLLAAIGGIIERHMKEIGFLRSAITDDTGMVERHTDLVCPSCGETKVVFQEGCKTCHSCGFSKCG